MGQFELTHYQRLEHIVAWFDKYLQGAEIHTYDVR